jgi:hypothetical protein
MRVTEHARTCRCTSAGVLDDEGGLVRVGHHLFGLEKEGDLSFRGLETI